MRKVMYWCFGVILCATFLASSISSITQAFTMGPTYKEGSTGTNVRELQERLKHIGFYTGDIDSIFGPRTKAALRLFQYEFGMTITGELNDKTKVRLYNATKNYVMGTFKPKEKGNQVNTSSNGFSSNDLKIMAQAVYGEARGEPYIGQVAVAAVILNRTQSPSFPNSPAAVVFEPRAFTAVADGQIYLTPNDSARKAVQDALKGWDPSEGATYYFNPDTATSAWIWSRPQIKKIGKHIFCR
ncbi:spore cortex-lytic enzyme [Brevibacillus laterosporus]|uniref:Spore cortex-lytic enzyme n=1 Tax=Brevibacillus laterosporus TaxID=1465 RepID=A0A502ITD3_BRELA|nr:spore cortex-lytic enzyme [Brevibacillus laterosporus]QDX93438.1 spore cortex-lytic enzyme [Brevibacillus laterosporus]TPG73186.1 spore cortex-lytic enzyme [Brevibacillus laterosporus]TPG89022.1 spore cortex-lytic enzyme [Brevibacillus laterosporus]